MFMNYSFSNLCLQFDQIFRHWKTGVNWLYYTSVSPLTIIRRCRHTTDILNHHRRFDYAFHLTSTTLCIHVSVHSLHRLYMCIIRAHLLTHIHSYTYVSIHLCSLNHDDRRYVLTLKAEFAIMLINTYNGLLLLTLASVKMCSRRGEENNIGTKKDYH